MEQPGWKIGQERGFLMNPDPLPHLSEVDTPFSAEMIAQIEDLAARMPDLMDAEQMRTVLDALPEYSFSLEQVDFRAVERLFMLYGYFASAYIFMTPEAPAQRLPAGVAVPLHRLAGVLARPPILSYCSYVLNNWQRIDPTGEINLDNLRLLQPFRGGRDEAWFILTHVDIEARAAQAIHGIVSAVAGVDAGDIPQVEAALKDIHDGVQAMMKSFRRMPQGCDSDVYYHKVRPYMFSFNDIVYEGVAEYGGKPQSFRGQTGAQSAVIPALVGALGLRHEQSGLTQHLDIMRDYMPKPHREFIQQMTTSRMRDFVIAHPVLKDAYNESLKSVLAFRRLHYHLAAEYIFKKVKNPIGTGGTPFMDWLGQLADETARQLV